MNKLQFDLIASLARLKHSSKARKAVAMVQQHGAKQTEAARVTGLNVSTVSRANARFIAAWNQANQLNKGE